MDNDCGVRLRTAIIICITIFFIALYLNANSVNCETISRRSRQLNEQFTKEWKPEHERLYEETLDAVLECLCENKNRISKLVMTVIRLKPLLNQICKYNSDYLCLEELIEPEILDILEKKAKGKHLDNQISDSNCKLCELLCDHCKHGKLNESEKNNSSDRKNEHFEGHVTQDTEIIPVYSKHNDHRFEMKSRNNDVSKEIKPLNRNPCEKCKKNPITDLISIINNGNCCIDKSTKSHQERHKKDIVVQITDNDDMKPLNNTAKHESDEDKITSSEKHDDHKDKVTEPDHSDEKPKHSSSEQNSKQNHNEDSTKKTNHSNDKDKEPKHESSEQKSKQNHNEDSTKKTDHSNDKPKHKDNEPKTEEQKHTDSKPKSEEPNKPHLKDPNKDNPKKPEHFDDKPKHVDSEPKSEEPNQLTQDKKFAQMNDILYKLLCTKPRMVYNPPHNRHEEPMSIYPDPGCLPKHLIRPLSYDEDEPSYLHNSQQPIARYNPCNNILPLHNPRVIDPNVYYNWMPPSYHKCSYFSDTDEYGTPYSSYSKTYSAKTDIEESYV